MSINLKNCVTASIRMVLNNFLTIRDCNFFLRSVIVYTENIIKGSHK